MSRVFIDGFESGDLSLWDNWSGAAAVVAVGATGLDGAYCCDLRSGGNGFIYKILPDATEYYLSVFYRTYSSSGAGYFGFRKNNENVMHLYVPLVSPIAAYAGSTSLTTANFLVSASTNYFIQMYVKVANSGGRFVVKINGETLIDFTGDTLTTAYSSMDALCIFSAGGYYVGYIDNVIVDSSQYPTISRIQSIVPSGAGNSTLWTPSTGSNYTCVDEKPPVDSDYISTNVNDNIDTYAFSNLSGSINSIKSVVLQSRIIMEGVSTPQHIKLIARPGSTDQLSSDFSIPLIIPKSVQKIWETNPDGGNWTESNVNASEFGIKSTA